MDPTDIHAYLVWEDVVGATPTQRDLAKLVSELPLQDSLVTLSKLMALLQSHPAAANNWFLEHLPRPQRRQIQRRFATSRIWLFDQRMAAVAKVLLLRAQPKPPTGLSKNESRRLAAAILMTPSALEEPTLPDSSDTRTWFHQIALWTEANHQNDPMGQIARYHQVYCELRERHVAHDVDVETLNRQVMRSSGLSIRRYLAAAAAIVVKHVTWAQGAVDGSATAADWIFRPGYVSSTAITEDEIRTVLRDVAASPAVLRKAMQGEVEEGKNLLRYLGTFARYPLCEVADDVFIPLYPRLLVDRLVGDGLYWRIYGAFPTAERSDAGSAVGRLFERYVVDALVSTHSTDCVFEEHEYKSGLAGPDAAVIDGSSRLAVIEVGVSRVNFETTLLNGHVMSFEDDIEKVVVRRARQLDAKIRALRKGSLAYPGVDTRLHRIFPVLVLFAGFPQAFSLYEPVQSRISALGLLDGRDVAPLSILSASDLDAALWVAEMRESSLLDALASWHAERTGPGESMQDFVRRHYQPRDGGRPAYLKSQYARATSSWAREMGFGGESTPAP